MGFCPYLDDVKDDEKSNGEKISIVVENSVGKKKVVDGNGCDGAINGKSTHYCSKETLIGRFLLIVMPLCCWIHICLSPFCLN